MNVVQKECFLFFSLIHEHVVIGHVFVGNRLYKFEMFEIMRLLLQLSLISEDNVAQFMNILALLIDLYFCFIIISFEMTELSQKIMAIDLSLIDECVIFVAVFFANSYLFL